MNDFTKEELKTIQYALITVYLGNSELKKKIQSMIDNYCEHDWMSGCASHDCHAECVWCPRCKKSLIKDLKC